MLLEVLYQMVNHYYIMLYELFCINLIDDIGSFFQSYSNPSFSSLVDPIPLVMLRSQHPNCTYKWECYDKDFGFPSTPVVFVNNSFVFQCSVYDNGKHLLSSAHFDMMYSPRSKFHSFMLTVMLT